MMMLCPACGSSRIRMSEHARKGDGFRRLLGQKAFRCTMCAHRYYASEAARGERHPEHGSGKRRRSRKEASLARRRMFRELLVLAVFLLAFLIFLLFLRFMTAERSSSMESPACPDPGNSTLCQV